MHWPEYGSTIIGDSNGLVLGSSSDGDKNLIHTSGAKSSFDEISDGNSTDKRWLMIMDKGTRRAI